MSIFELMGTTNNKEVMFFEEASVGLKAIIAVHNTVLGTAVATSRLYNYKTEEEAVADALNLAYYNTYRSALLRRNFGGGSIVLYGDPKKVKSEMYFRALGIFLNKMNGKIFMAKGPGLDYVDLLDVKRESNYLLGLSEKNIATAEHEITSTAKGMIWGLKAAVKENMDKPNLQGLTIVVQGIGEIGSNLVQGLLAENVNVVITDLVYDKIKVIQDKVPNIKVVKPEEIYKEKCDIFCSCAFNGLINAKHANQLNCKILSGSVDQILESNEIYSILKTKNIQYVPGFLINTGEIIQFSKEIDTVNYRSVDEQLNDIYHITLNIIRLSKAQNRIPDEIAFEMAEAYISSVASIKMLK